MDEKVILGSMAMDLKRAALGFQRGSSTMANKFLEEAIKRKKECRQEKVEPYIRNILNKIEALKFQSEDNMAESALMYSTLIQNFVLKHN